MDSEIQNKIDKLIKSDVSESVIGNIIIVLLNLRPCYLTHITQKCIDDIMDNCNLDGYINYIQLDRNNPQWKQVYIYNQHMYKTNSTISTIIDKIETTKKIPSCENMAILLGYEQSLREKVDNNTRYKHEIHIKYNNSFIPLYGYLTFKDMDEELNIKFTKWHTLIKSYIPTAKLLIIHSKTIKNQKMFE
jgi:hypothetical protein